MALTPQINIDIEGGNEAENESGIGIENDFDNNPHLELINPPVNKVRRQIIKNNINTLKPLEIIETQ